MNPIITISPIENDLVENTPSPRPGVAFNSYPIVKYLSLRHLPYPIFNLNIDYLNTVLNCNQKKELCESGKEFFEFDKKKIWINFKENKIKISNSFSKKEIKFLLDYLSEQKLSSENSIELELNVSRITFLIETTGVLSVENIFKESILVLKRKLNILGVHLEKIH